MSKKRNVLKMSEKSIEKLFELMRDESFYDCVECKFKCFCRVCVHNEKGYMVPVRNDVESVKDINVEEFVMWNIDKLEKEKNYSVRKIMKVFKELEKIEKEIGLF